MEEKNSKLQLLTSGIVVESTEVITALSSKDIIPEEYFAECKERYFMNGEFEKFIYEPIKSTPISVPTLCFEKFSIEGLIEDSEIREFFGIVKPSDFLTPAEILWIIMYLTAKYPCDVKGCIKTEGNTTLIGYFISETSMHTVYVGRTLGLWSLFCTTSEKSIFGENDELLKCTNVKDIHLVH